MVLAFVGSLSLARPSCQATNWLSGLQKRDGSDNDLNTIVLKTIKTCPSF